MLDQDPHVTSRVALLIDCENAMPDIVDHAVQVSARFGRVVVRRGFGNHATLANKWQQKLVEQAFTPCLQFPAAPGKNTSDIALALDALALLVDRRADVFCLVTSDSDFAGLCRKLRERGATVHVIGEAKTPAALRNASDQFFEWEPATEAVPVVAVPPLAISKSETSVRPRRPRSIVNAVRLLAADSPDGRVHVSGLGSYLRRMDPAFSPAHHGHPGGLLSMLKTYDLLDVRQEPRGHWTVSAAADPETV